MNEVVMGRIRHSALIQDERGAENLTAEIMGRCDHSARSISRGAVQVGKNGVPLRTKLGNRLVAD